MFILQIKGEKGSDYVITFLITILSENAKIWVGRTTLNGEKRGWPYRTSIQSLSHHDFTRLITPAGNILRMVPPGIELFLHKLGQWEKAVFLRATGIQKENYSQFKLWVTTNFSDIMKHPNV